MYSIGYQGLKLPHVISAMTKRGICLLVDLRCKPNSRQRDFNRNVMARVLGDKYIWKGDSLGGFCGPVPQEAIDWLAHLKGRVLIMCMEHDPLKCHRYQDIARRLLRDHAIDVIHIVDDQEYPTSELVKKEIV
jgi:uncharacterized protein (DUF488 family)